MNLFEGKVAAITGSTSGIGRETAVRLSEQGATVVLNSSRSKEAGEKLADLLGDATYIQGSIADPGFAKTFVDEIAKRYGRLDILVNNAATTKVIPHSDLRSADRDTWREIFELNVFGTFDLITEAKDLLEQSEGQILNVASIAGVRPSGSSIPYAASKASLIHMTKLLAVSLGPRIRVNAIAPGLVDTPWTQSWDTVREAYIRTAPLKASASPQDVAAVISAILQAPYLTGCIVPVDGGFGLVR